MFKKLKAERQVLKARLAEQKRANKVLEGLKAGRLVDFEGVLFDFVPGDTTALEVLAASVAAEARLAGLEGRDVSGMVSEALALHLLNTDVSEGVND